MKIVKYTILLALLIGVVAVSSAAIQPIDSTGLETVNGKTYIIHNVAQKETLFSLSQRYHTTVDDIKIANEGLNDDLKIGQTIRVPYVKTSVIPSGAIAHTVAPGETLYAISKKYDVTIQDIKQWNSLTANSLDLGQNLVLYPRGNLSNASPGSNLKKVTVQDGDMTHTVQATETLYSISRKYGVSVNDLKKINQLSGNDLDLGQILIIRNKRSDKNTAQNINKSKKTTTPSPQTTEPATKRKSEYDSYEKSMNDIKRVNTTNSSNNSTEASFNKKVEIGFAEVIKANTTSKKWLALHHTAPIGTIIRVQNQMNNSWVFVRVVGILPNTGVNDKVLIKISETAYEKLGAINDRFPVEISYVP